MQPSTIALVTMRASGLAPALCRTLARSASTFTPTSLPESVKIVEVGPRDGLQNEKKFVPTSVKKDFIQRLASAGVSVIETTSFVSPKWVPQMSDNAELYAQIEKLATVDYPVLVPNKTGYEQAAKAGVKEVAIFASASETFSKKNINCTIEESLARFEPIFAAAKKDGIKIRGYVSCVGGCPYEGAVDPKTVAEISDKLFQHGCYEISLGDTIGKASPAVIWDMLGETVKRVPIECLAGHYHDTYGQALTNILASLQMGMRVFDSSVAGLGGCPYADGASGNVATEEVVYMLNGMGISTGIDLEKLIDTGVFISKFLDRPNGSKVSVAMAGTQGKSAPKEDEACRGHPKENRGPILSTTTVTSRRHRFDNIRPL